MEQDARFVLNSQNIFINASAQNYTPHEEGIQHHGKGEFIPRLALEQNRIWIQTKSAYGGAVGPNKLQK